MSGSDYKPLAEKAEVEVLGFFKLWRRKRWLAIGLLIALGGWGLIPLCGWIDRGSKINELERDVKQLKDDLRFERAENKSLKEVVSPLLQQAIKEFPGEEIKSSLKKVLERIDYASPRKQQIATCSAVVRITVQGGAKTNWIGAMGYDVARLNFYKTPHTGTFFPMVADKYQIMRAQDVCVYVLEFREDPIARSLGHASKTATEIIDDINALDLMLWFLPPSEIKNGSVTMTLNSSVHREFPIPPQKTDDSMPMCYVSSMIKGSTKSPMPRPN